MRSILKPLPPGKVVRSETPGLTITVSWRSAVNGLGARGTIDIGFIDGEWWVNRALVQGALKIRSKGVGSTLLQMALGHVVAAGGTRVHVCPGGYGSDPKRQQLFYEKNGFVCNKDIWVWTLDRSKPPPVPPPRETQE